MRVQGRAKVCELINILELWVITTVFLRLIVSPKSLQAVVKQVDILTGAGTQCASINSHLHIAPPISSQPGYSLADSGAQKVSDQQR